MHQIDHDILSSSSSAPPASSVAVMFLAHSASTTSSSILPYPTLPATITTSPFGNSTFANGTSAGAVNGECRLLGPFALFVQGALGLLALLSLVFKRWRERPQRPVKIWAFDASKQVVGSSLLHVANLFMSMVSSGDLKPKADKFQANPCSFYLLNLAIDVRPYLLKRAYRPCQLTYLRPQSAYPSSSFSCAFLPMAFRSRPSVIPRNLSSPATMVVRQRPNGGLSNV